MKINHGNIHATRRDSTSVHILDSELSENRTHWNIVRYASIAVDYAVPSETPEH